MKKPIIKIILAILLIMNLNSSIYAKTPSYLTLTPVDYNTFNEYGYKISQQAFRLEERFSLDQTIDTEAARRIGNLATLGYKYLPDHLENEKLLRMLKTQVQKGINSPTNESNYETLKDAIINYLNNNTIQVIDGTIDVFPNEGNAPLTATLKGSVEDPSGSNLLDHNYTWWLDVGGKRKVIGNKPTIKYTFTREGNITVFLEVKSNHRNIKTGKIDTLPFKGRTVINVKSKIASLIVNVNGKRLENEDKIKFEPLESSYGLIFDATSSTPTQGTEFKRTTWDFGNNVKKSYKGRPQIERIIYATEGIFDVVLELETNEGKIVKKEFQIDIHKPIATIKASKEEGFLGDKFTFTSKSSSKDKNLVYTWEVINVEDDAIINKKIGKVFNYQFSNKGKFNVKLKVKNAAGETDIDNKIIYINSKSPVADFTTSIINKSKPNTVFFDGSKSYDPDFTDDGNLKYYWIIDGKRVDLNKSNESGSTGYYTFDSIGEHTVSLEVRDSDGISNIKKGVVTIKSILAVDFVPMPKVTKRNGFIRFLSTSPEAKIYKWDFGDGKEEGGTSKKINHYYNKSGSFKVKLTVNDKNDNENSITKLIYVAESDEPLAIIDIISGSKSTLFKEKQCDSNGTLEGAYIVDRTTAINMKSSNSINVDGKNTGLTYSWKLDNGKRFSESNISYKYDEIGCHKVKLTVTSENDGKSNSTYTWLKVINLKPSFKSLNLTLKDESADPIVVTATAIGAKDQDGIIQSYLWYYYTDSDNEPQGFRSTRKNFTTFVLPKIAGKYHFMLMMKDNNSGKTESKKGENFITISGDNINTPLINLIVNDTSISTSQEIVFNTNVENILGDNLTNKAKYSWDFDGDGFYDIETSKPIVTHKYKKSGEFHAKVKVKYKGFSNVKSVVINVENKLSADFEYISIGNKFIFFNSSNGTIKSMIWDMGNGDKIRGKNNFIYTYKDKESSHKVKLSISEGSKSSIKEKKVVKKIANILKARKKGINIFSIPDLGKDNNVILKNQTDNLFLYIGESRGDYAYYPIDYDINFDYDLNGGKDDDEDNKGEESYTSGAPLKVPLNNKKEQEIRIFFKDSEQEVIETIDIKITKEYIEEETIQEPEELKDFVASDYEKEIVNDLKKLIGLLPEENKTKALSYITKIQNNWSDSTEKTRTIIEFEEYLSSIESTQTDDIYDLLETLLLQDGGDTNNININALRKLVPENIVCQEIGDFGSCYEYVLDLLEQINNSANIEEKKKLGGKILEIISKQSEDIITIKQGYDFKAILKSLIYGGSTEIPICAEGLEESENCRKAPLETCKDGQTENCIQPINQNSEGGTSILGTIGNFLMYALFILLGGVFLFFIYYKLTNKNNNGGFDDFIMDKTNPTEEKEIDVLGGIKDDKESKNEDILAKEIKPSKESITKNNDIFSTNKSDKIKTLNKNTTTPPPKKKEDEKIPSWLNLENGDSSKKKIEKKIDLANGKEKINSLKEGEKDVFKEIEKDNTPDWLKGSFTETNKKNKPKEDEFKKDIPKKETKPESKENKKSNNNKTPDWLKTNTSDNNQNKVNSEKIVEKNITTEKTIITEKKIEVKPDNKAIISKHNLSVNKKEDIKTDITANKTFENIPGENDIIGDNIIESQEKEVKEKTVVLDKIIEKKDNTPDWLKNEHFKVKNKKTTGNSINGKSIDIPDWLTGDNLKNNEIENNKIKLTTPADLKGDNIKPDIIKIKNEDKTKNVKNIKNKTIEIDLTPDVEKENNKTLNNSINKKNDDMELWNDGMKVPDWLKTDDNK